MSLTQAYTEWVNLFDDNMTDIWNKNESSDIRKLLLIEYAFIKESQRIEKLVAERLNNTKQIVLSSQKRLDENTKQSTESTISFNNACTTDSSSVFILENMPHEEFDSPPLNLKQTRPKVSKFTKDSVKRNIYKLGNNVESDEDILECSVVDVTPISEKTRKNVSKKRKMFSRRNNSSLKLRSISKPEVTLKTVKQPNYNVKDDNSMEISDILRLLDENKDQEEKQSLSNVDDDETYCDLAEANREIHKENQKIDPKSLEIVRGKARKQLPGWSCNECKLFYEAQALSEEELIQKMNDCSRHRSKFKYDETLPGFWDMKIRSQSTTN